MRSAGSRKLGPQPEGKALLVRAEPRPRVEKAASSRLTRGHIRKVKTKAQR